jgi:hypothetical protein
MARSLFSRKLECTLNACGTAAYEVTYGNINSGGCAVFACAIAHHLAQLPVHHALRASTFTDADIDLIDVVNTYRDDGGLPAMNHSGFFLSHVFVETWFTDPRSASPVRLICDARLRRSVRDIHPDDHLETCPLGYDVYKQRAAVEDLLPFARARKGWNETFCREWIPRIFTDINKCFSPFNTTPITTVGWEV